VNLVVADASAIAEYVLQTSRGMELRTLIESSDQDLHVPALCDVEVAAVLRGALLRHRMEERRVREALDDYAALPLTRHGHLALLPRALALRSNFSAYDAIYVALAERLGASLLTADRSLARAVTTHLAIPSRQV
jgi:predicted nucleic acid-binding protein